MSKLEYPWTRFWLGPTRKRMVDGQGYLVDPLSDHWAARQSELRSTAQALAAQNAIVLGDPGAGKSTAITRAVELRAGARDPADVFELVQLRDYKDQSFLSERLKSLPALHAWRSGTHRIHLFLDSLDECLQRHPIQAWATISTWLTELQRERDRICLRVVCRTAELPSNVRDDVARWSQDHEFEILELAPLVRTEIEAALVTCHVPKDDFLEVIRARNLQELASNPITLDMLIREFRRGELHSCTQLEIYERGCLALCDDHTGAASDGARSTAAQRLNASMRFALASVLANIPDMLVDDGVVSSEWSLRELARCLDPDSNALREAAIRSGLFSASSTDRLSFSHPVYCAYLAARAAHGLSIPWSSLRAALVTRVFGRDTVPSAFRAVLAWIGALMSDAWDDLQSFAPDILLGAEIADDKRPSLAHALLEQARRFEHRGFDLDGRSDYRRLNHPQLASALRPLILDRHQPPHVRTLAIRIAAECGLREIADVIVAVACDLSEAIKLREMAASAFDSVLAEDSELTELRCLVTLPHEEDPNDNLLGYALDALWPSHCSFAEMLSFLRVPYEPHHLGSYQIFLHKLPGRVEPPDIPALMHHLSELHWGQPEGTSARLMAQLVNRCASEGIAGGPEAVADYAMQRFKQYRGLPDYPAEGEEAHALHRNDSFRRSVISLLAIRGAKASSLTRAPSILLPQDFGWLLEEAKDASDGKLSQSYSAYVRDLFDRSIPGQIDMVSAAISSRPSLRSDLASLVAPSARDLKETIREPRGGQALPPSRTEIMSRLRAPDQRTIERWAAFTMDLGWNKDGTQYGRNDSADITTLPGWASLTPEDRAEAVDVAQKLVEEPPTPQDHPNALFPLRAALLLLQVEVALPLHSGWKAPLLEAAHYCRDTGGESYTRALRTIYQNGPVDFIAELQACANRGSLTFNTLRAIEPFVDPSLQSALEEVLDARPLNADAGSLFDLLLRRRSAAASRYATDALNLLCETAPVTNEWKKLVSAISTWLVNSPDNVWPIVRDLQAAHAREFRAVIEYLAERCDVDRSLLTKWDDERLAQLVEVAMKLAPIQTRTGRHRSSSDLSDLMRSAINELASRGRVTAFNALLDFSRADGEYAWLAYKAHECRALAAERTWQPLSLKSVQDLLQDAKRPLVASNYDLMRLVLSTLHDLNGVLQGVTPAVRDLWNETPNAFSPKDEDAMTDWVKRQLESRLNQHGVIGARNTEIVGKSGKGSGQEVDLMVSVVANPSGGAYQTFQVAIEAKGCWNQKLKSQMKDQLVDKYLATVPSACGIYLVGWFACERWASDDKKRKTPKWNLAKAREVFDEQAKALSSPDKVVTAVVLDASYK